MKKNSFIKKIFNCGLFAYNSSAYKNLIKLVVKDAIMDILFLHGLFLLLITIIRIPNLLRDLYRMKNISLTSFEMKYIIWKNINELMSDVYFISNFILYTVMIIITIVGLPSYLSDLRSKLSTVEEAADCAQKHFKNLLYYFFVSSYR